jgi:hypothetical protein
MFPVAVCVAALLAHLAIDAFGDFALARDAYDAVAHDSRTLIVLAMLCVAVAAGLRFVISALDPAVRTRRAGLLARLVPRTPVTFALSVLAAATVVLAAMETLDTLASTGRVEDLADAFGGSLVFGLGIAVPIALAVAAVAWFALRWFGRARGEIIKAIATLFSLRSRPRVALSCGVAGLTAFVSRERASQARRAGKRGPPLLPYWLTLR